MLPGSHRPFGDSAVLVELDDLQQVLDLDRALRRDPPPWVSDVIPAARTVLVRFDADASSAQQVSSWIAAAGGGRPAAAARDGSRPGGATGPDGQTGPGGATGPDGGGPDGATGPDGGGPDNAAASTVSLPVRYDGADLAEVARMTGLTVPEVIDLHCGTRYTVAFCGFAPGFAYLAGVPAVLRVPRRASPRTAVPAGAVALAGEFCAVYPRKSPGGWQLIGSTDQPVFDIEREPPVLLSPGMRVRFVQVPG